MRSIRADTSIREVEDEWNETGDEKMCMDCVLIVGGLIGCWVLVGAAEAIFSVAYVIAKKIGF